MSEPVDLVDRIAADLAGVRWPEAAEIRRTARVRRGRRAALAAALAVVGIAGVSVAVLDHRAISLPTVAVPPVSPAAEQILIPAAAMLDGTDLGRATDANESFSDPPNATGTDPFLDICATDRRHSLQRTARDQKIRTLLRHRPATEEHSSADYVLQQRLFRLPVAQAGQFMTDLGSAVAACSEWVSAGKIERAGKVVPASTTHRWRMVAGRFAGDESTIVEHSFAAEVAGQAVETSRPSLIALVRVGDLVTVITPKAGTPLDVLSRWSAAAATRMCATANPSC
jgi:hypothetical protein